MIDDICPVIISELDAVPPDPTYFYCLDEVVQLDHPHSSLLWWGVHLVGVDPVLLSDWDVSDEVIDCGLDAF